MEIKVIATSNSRELTPKDQLDNFGGHAAAVCYTSAHFDDIRAEDLTKTQRRIEMTKTNGHHSVYGHTFITLYLINIPRVVEAIITNERDYASSIKSGRYTKHILTETEQGYYDKWLARFKELIQTEYQQKSPTFFTNTRIEKLAMENARYLTSCFTQISMLYTVSYRQFNYLYGFIGDFIKKHAKTKNTFLARTRDSLADFKKLMEGTGYIDEHLPHNGKDRVLSMFNNYTPVEYFGDIYVTSYTGTLAYYLHANKHRTIKYYIAEPDTKNLQYYIPELIRENEELAKEWLADCEALKANFPQAMLFSITETSNLDDLKLKIVERKCAVVLLETNQQIRALITKYHNALVENNHPRAKELAIYTKGARCTFPGFKCTHPCAFKEAINETRKV